MKFYRLAIFFGLLLTITSCGTLKEGFKNPKKDNSDEFLVEKKSPLVMPPEFGELPIPKNNTNTEDKDEKKIKKLIINQDNKKDTISGKNITNFEESLLEKIKKN